MNAVNTTTEDFDFASLFDYSNYVPSVATIEEVKVSTKVSATVCPRCNGAGNISCYKHRHNGICFRCNGTGK